jgi:hypothetical protein
VSEMIRPLSLALLLVAQALAEPIKLHPSNPHYYVFNGQPTVLITSAEHYGAVINLDFDYVAYLDALKAYGLNYAATSPAMSTAATSSISTNGTRSFSRASRILS